MRILMNEEARMKKTDVFEDPDPAASAWGMFEKTGNLAYYLLYKRLTEK